MRVVPPLDEVEHCHARLGLGFEAGAVEQFAFQGGEKTFAHGVVETVAHRAHRRPYAGLVAAFARRERGVLGEVKRSSPHLDRQNCDAYSKAPFRSVRARTVAMPGPAA